MLTVTDQDLRTEIAEMRQRFPRLQDSELFVAWFLKSFVTEDEGEAVAALVGGPRDKSLDAILVDDAAKVVFVVQGKYRQWTSKALEHRPDVMTFASVAEAFEDNAAFSSLLQELETGAAGKAEEGRKRIRKRGYRLQLYYVTTGRCSASLISEAERQVRRTDSAASIDVLDGKRVLRLLSDYLDGVAPPVPILELEIENGHGVTLGGVLQRYDGSTKIESWVFPVTVRNIAEMYEQSGVRLFARNVRGFLGDTPINRNMEATLEKEPQFFWYYNNGITFICDRAEQSTQGGRKLMRIVNPQVINGQQTTRTLHRKAAKNSKATVMVRVISVPRETDEDESRFDALVSKIVGATNWQDAIRASDLMANDRRQIELERNLRKLDYQYIRERQTKGEARRQAGVRHRFMLKKEELAQAVAACDLDPSVVREGKERLFEERLYDQVFPNADPNYYLPRYWTVWWASSTARGYPQRAYAKWVVAHFAWQRIIKVLSTRTQREQFARMNERYYSPGLDSLFKAAHKGVLEFYRLRRGSGATASDPSTFFQRKGLHRDLAQFWPSASGTHRHQVARGLKMLRSELQEFADDG